MRKLTNRMNQYRPLKLWMCATVLLILNTTRTLFGADAAVAKQILNPFGLNENTLRSLEEKKQKQPERLGEMSDRGV